MFAKTSRTNARQEGELDVGLQTDHLLSTAQSQLSYMLIWFVVADAAEIIMFDDYLVVYKQLGDLMFYVTGSLAENELILHAALQAFYEAISTLLR